jgi:hypothetical protein
MLNAILLAILIVLIVFSNYIAFVGGFYFGRKYKQPKADAVELTKEQEAEIEKIKRQEKQFWDFKG